MGDRCPTCVGVLAKPSPRTFGGWVFHSEDAPSLQSLVIDSQEEWHTFQSKLPKKQPTKRQPAPDNDDPLIGLALPDFNKEVLVVAVHGQTISHPPLLRSIETNGKSRLVFRPRRHNYGRPTVRMGHVHRCPSA